MLIVESISKSYGKQQILKDISFQASAGESIAIIGKNGCGKSTLLQILAGVMKPDGGQLSYYGKNPMKEKKVFAERCGYLPQANPLLEELTVSDNLRLFGFRGTPEQKLMLAPLELEEFWKKPVGKLSGGMKRRVAIACAVFYMPAILFMDEPTTALDIYFKNSIHEWIRGYQRQNGILIMATHEEQEIALCDRCFYMKEGLLTELSAEQKTSEAIRRLVLEH